MGCYASTKAVMPTFTTMLSTMTTVPNPPATLIPPSNHYMQNFGETMPFLHQASSTQFSTTLRLVR